MMGSVLFLINLTVQIVTLLVIAHVLMSYFLSPYHPARQFVDRLVEPMLAPIRRMVPPAGMFDFSPIVLILLVELLGIILRQLLISL
jgi:YggT family protein